MVRSKNANYGLGESPMELGESSRGRLVYEDPTESSEEDESSRTISDINATTIPTEPAAECGGMRPLEMWFKPTEYTKKIKIPTRCYITEAVETLEKLKHPLREEEKRWFNRHPQFRHFFHIPKDKNHKVMGMWMLLLRTAKTDKRKEAWFIVNGVPIRYGLREHALLSGLDCRNYPMDYMQMGSMDFVEKHFGRGAKVRYADIKEKLKVMKPSQDRLKMAVLFFLSSIIIGVNKTGADAPAVEPFFQRAVHDLHLCKTFPWGRMSFDHIMREISHTMKHFNGVVKGTQWTMPIFCTPLELLAFESIPALRKTFRDDFSGADNSCPRMCKSMFKRSAMRGFTLDEINDALGNTKDIMSILVPSPDEETLLERVYEVDDDPDKNDVVVEGWMKLIEENKLICFDKMYRADVASRAGKETENVGDEGNILLLEGAPSTEGPEAGLVDLVHNLKKDMEEGFKNIEKKIDEKFSGLNTRVLVVEAYVKEQLDVRRQYKDTDYVFNDNQTHLEAAEDELQPEKCPEEVAAASVEEQQAEHQNEPQSEPQEELQPEKCSEEVAAASAEEQAEQQGEPAEEQAEQKSEPAEEQAEQKGEPQEEQAEQQGEPAEELQTEKDPQASASTTTREPILYTRKRKRNPSTLVKTPFTRWPKRKRNDGN